MNYTATVSIKDARNNLSELIDRAAIAQESFLITKFGKAKAIIIPAKINKTTKNKRLEAIKQTAGIWKNRKDITDSAKWVAEKRRVWSTRYGKIFN